MKLPLPDFEHPFPNGKVRLVRRVAFATVLAALTTVGVKLASAAERPVPKTYPGGLAAPPYIYEFLLSTQKLTLKWFGLRGPYRVERSLNLGGATWESVGILERGRAVTLDAAGNLGFFRVVAPPPTFAGGEACMECHGDYHGQWAQTRHAKALETLQAIHQDKNPTCLVCHTVGFGLPSGFQDAIRTPHLKGVQCESCHGPAADHANNPENPALRPITELSALTCGGCHTEAHHPTFDEWSKSGHASLELPREEFADPATGPGRMPTCGACHSGATRAAMMRELRRRPKPEEFKPVMPTPEEAASTPIVCATCHDPHQNTAAPSQLRFPLASKMPYSYLTSTNFAKNFNAEVQLCAQCHNMRGATWTGTGRPPHYSPQYNLLIGKGGFEAGITNIPQSKHMDMENQCAHCHTHPHSPDEITEQNPAYTGHEFKPTFQACRPCHDEAGAEMLKTVTQTNTRQQIARIKDLLVQWATTKAPEALRQKYGPVAWEFTTIGELSTLPAGVTSGPVTADQAMIPDNIKQARFNLYLVNRDGSFGVHNGNYARFLLKVAEDKVKAELAP